MRKLQLFFLIVFLIVLSSCNSAPTTGDTVSTGSQIALASNPSPSPTQSQSQSQSPSPSPPPSGTLSSGWELTVYYTAVESYHSGAATSVSGCLNLECTSKGVIGSYPSDFLKAVKNEGTGRITSASHAGEYLNWSYDVGYWLDTAPRDSYGNALVPFVSAAADTNVMALGTKFIVSQCGQGADAGFCTQVMSADWKISDQFTPGMGGTQHLDLYIGEEDQANFESTSPKYTTLTQAVLTILP